MPLQPQSHNQDISQNDPNGEPQVALFGGGCFWGLELMFSRLEGVTKTKVGYAQGHLENPTYNSVKKGTSGHVEVVEVIFFAPPSNALAPQLPDQWH